MKGGRVLLAEGVWDLVSFFSLSYFFLRRFRVLTFFISYVIFRYSSIFIDFQATTFPLFHICHVISSISLSFNSLNFTFFYLIANFQTIFDWFKFT